MTPVGRGMKIDILKSSVKSVRFLFFQHKSDENQSQNKAVEK